jgi:hypothetical protein
MEILSQGSNKSARSAWAGGSGWFQAERKAARPKNGRPLQNLPRSMRDGFVAAVLSRDFRDRTGIFFLFEIARSLLRINQRSQWDL